MASSSVTIAEYVVNRLADLGIDRAFGVPGDYVFPFDDALEKSDRLGWVAIRHLARKITSTASPLSHTRRRQRGHIRQTCKRSTTMTHTAQPTRFIWACPS